MSSLPHVLPLPAVRHHLLGTCLSLFTPLYIIWSTLSTALCSVLILKSLKRSPAAAAPATHSRHPCVSVCLSVCVSLTCSCNLRDTLTTPLCVCVSVCLCVCVSHLQLQPPRHTHTSPPPRRTLLSPCPIISRPSHIASRALSSFRVRSISASTPSPCTRVVVAVCVCRIVGTDSALARETRLRMQQACDEGDG